MENNDVRKRPMRPLAGGALTGEEGLIAQKEVGAQVSRELRENRSSDREWPAKFGDVVAAARLVIMHERARRKHKCPMLIDSSELFQLI